MMLARSAIPIPALRVPAVPVAVQLAALLALAALFADPTVALVSLLAAAVLALTSRARGTDLDTAGWLRHLLEMVVAMYVGMFLFHHLVKPALIGLGYGAALGGDLSYTWMLVSMVLGMATIMVVEGHRPRMITEMSLGMVVPVIACFALVRFGISPVVPALSWLTTANLYDVAHTSMLLGMLAVMVWRSGMYGRAHASLELASL